MPLKGTPTENVKPPHPMDVIEIIITARFFDAPNAIIIRMRTTKREL